MKEPTVNSFIKTTCGRKKYQELRIKKGFFSQMRLYWFIFIATIKDWNIPLDHNEDSNS